MYVHGINHVHTRLELFLTFMWVFQHAHIVNIKTVANLSNNKDVFMCILCFHPRAGYLQHYETLLKELNEHPASDPVSPDQYEVERAALSDRNLNVPCESGIRYPSMLVMLHHWQTQSKISVIFCLVHVHTVLWCVCTCAYQVHTSMSMSSVNSAVLIMSNFYKVLILSNFFLIFV